MLCATSKKELFDWSHLLSIGQSDMPIESIMATDTDSPARFIPVDERRNPLSWAEWLKQILLSYRDDGIATNTMLRAQVDNMKNVFGPYLTPQDEEEVDRVKQLSTHESRFIR